MMTEEEKEKLIKWRAEHPLSEEAKAARIPPSPDSLVGALPDPIHRRAGHLIAATPIKFPTEEDTRQKEIVAMVERLLEEAKAGKLDFLLVIARTDKGEIDKRWSSAANFIEMVGMIEYAKNRYIANHSAEAIK